MIAELGLIFLILSIIFSLSHCLYPSLKSILSNNLINIKILPKKISNLVFVTTFLSFCCLTYCFIISDFSLLITSQNSNSQLPLIYKITGVWGNHEGSMLLWLLVMTFFGFLFARHEIKNIELKNNVLLIQSALCFLIGLFIIFTSNPFERIYPPAIEGKDLNPLLQDPGLAIHPPFLYLGYVGTSIVYSLALATLMNKKPSNELIKLMKPWVFLSWTCLTFGIGLGSWWAYYELGWGGFWFWDPVENASLLPWLTSTALLHSIVVSNVKGKLVSWSLLLAIITFCLSLMGTFLVRSGVLTSVHAFATDPSRGVFILCLLILISGVGAFYYLKSIKNLREIKYIAPISKEGAISINNILMLTITSTILIGTLYPLVTDAFFDKKISVGAPFFNSVILPFTIPMIVGMIIGPFLKWEKDDIIKVFSKIKLLLIINFLVLLISWYYHFKSPVLAVVFITFALWLATSSVFILFESFMKNKIKNKVPFKVLSQSLAHFGIALFIIGSTGTSIIKEEKIQFQERGDTIDINNYEIKFLGVVEKNGPNYRSDVATFNIYKDNKYMHTLNPERRYYNYNKKLTTEAAIYSTLLGDIYIAIGALSKGEKNESLWTTRIWYNTYTIWIWLGVMFMVFGGITSVFNSFKKL